MGQLVEAEGDEAPRSALGARDPAELMAFARTLAGIGDWTRIAREAAQGALRILGPVVRGVSVLLDTRGAPESSGHLTCAHAPGSADPVEPLSLAGRPLLERALSGSDPLSAQVTDASLRGVFDTAARDQANAVATLFPIVAQHGTRGLLCVWHAQSYADDPTLSSFAEAAAQAVALSLDTVVRARASEFPPGLTVSLDGDSIQVAELTRYLSLFESSRDAMLVMDLKGNILFANPVASYLTGETTGTLLGKSFTDLLDTSSVELASSVIAEFSRGKYPVGVDFQLVKHSAGGGPQMSRLVSVNFSSVMRETNAVLATMRDVTQERALRRELSQTRDFLQRVIESSVDGIVSADMRGEILVYNQAASRIFGYDRDEVIGQMNVKDLYPPGVARDVMRRIRDKEYGGRGRLSEYRVDMRTRVGERIPVSLSASLVMDGRRPVGTVGIFTDVRDKLAMEARLSRAQRELQNHEKQAAIAELAGAAAHELNQPLTAVMGYAEYLKRTMGADPAQLRAVDVILGETERMANIVRKVGRITRYETKPYVGGAKIVDIEASSGPEE